MARTRKYIEALKGLAHHVPRIAPMGARVLPNRSHDRRKDHPAQWGKDHREDLAGRQLSNRTPVGQ
jgi:hypothetical protein